MLAKNSTHVKKPLSAGIPAFTLTELLVTIAIIASMAVLSTVLTRRYMDSAGQAVNVTNLKNLTVASVRYASDHDGWLPPASYYGNHIPQRAWPLQPLLQENYVNAQGLSSPLALPVKLAGGGPNQVPVLVAGYSSSGELTIDWMRNVTKSPVTVAFEAWANPEGWFTRGAKQKIGMDAKDFYGDIHNISASKMKILWNYQYDIPVNKKVVAIAFADGHVESRLIKTPRTFDDVMAE